MSVARSRDPLSANDLVDGEAGAVLADPGGDGAVSGAVAGGQLAHRGVTLRHSALLALQLRQYSF